jgi:hypothetical protein
MGKLALLEESFPIVLERRGHVHIPLDLLPLWLDVLE